MSGSLLHRCDLQKLIVALYYPAVIGVGFVVCMLKLLTICKNGFTDFHWSTDGLSMAFTLVLLFYFSFSYLASDKVSSKDYSIWLFLCDAFEALLLLGIFWALGFADAGEGNTPEFALFFFLLFLIAVNQVVWHLIRKNQIGLGPGISAIFCFVIAAIGFYIHSTYPWLGDRAWIRSFVWLDWLLMVGVTLLAVIYMCRVAKEPRGP
jgi:hypothetical protein